MKFKWWYSDFSPDEVYDVPTKQEAQSTSRQISKKYRALRQKYANYYVITAGIGVAGVFLYFNNNPKYRDELVITSVKNISDNVYGDLENAKPLEPCRESYKPHQQLVFNDDKQVVTLPFKGVVLRRMMVWRYNELQLDENGKPCFKKDGLPLRKSWIPGVNMLDVVAAKEEIKTDPTNIWNYYNYLNVYFSNASIKLSWNIKGSL